MSIVTWSFPTRILFGVGAASKTGAEAARLGAKRALIVTDVGVVKAGVLAPIEASLREAGVEVAVFDGVVGNPTEANVHDGVKAFQAHRADLVVSVGGGSPLDVGKLIALKSTHERPLVDYDDATGGDAHIGPNVPPIVTIPTTAGTGSEVGRSGVVTLDANHRKTVIFSPYLLAKAAILDPELTKTMPPHVTAATGFDALTHCLEAYVSKGDHPMADAIALEGLRLVGESLERAVVNGADLEARGDMMKAAMMGAVAFQKGLGACHSIAHPLSSECGLHHGLANALALPAVTAWNAADPATAKRLGRAAQALGVGSTADELVSGLRGLRDRLGLPAGLDKAGVPSAKLDAIADLAFVDACHQSNPRACTRDDLRKLIDQAFAG